MNAILRHTVTKSVERLRADLLDQQTSDGHWTGYLSSSALSTATAVSALAMADPVRFESMITAGVDWLAANQNADGGWGDTTDSPSNLSTTMLARAAIRLAQGESALGTGMGRSDQWIRQAAGPESHDQVRALKAIYGKDRTFVVPIMMNCALAGQVEWGRIPPLPFELAAAPHGLMKALRLHVVSYALPALIAIGQLLHDRRPIRNPLSWGLRRALRKMTLRKLESIQPESGGFLEAAPLTSFVVMSLCALNLRDHPVARRGLDFLSRSFRADGSWPIDEDLSMWVTTSAVTALCQGNASIDLTEAREWILDHQWRRIHPYTQTEPGGWAWTDRPGGVPDGDDTSGALLALAALGGDAPDAAVRDGVRWLMDLQNTDGGWPTFCRGWNRLPFDQSSCDITAHALRVLRQWRAVAAPESYSRCIRRGWTFLGARQDAAGAWRPLWFGNQSTPDASNPVFGTARVLRAYGDWQRLDDPVAQAGVAYLLRVQNTDGGWGGGAGAPSTIEETALAIDGLCDWVAPASLERAVRWLTERIEAGDYRRPQPIGLYFAMLWYSERLYPMIWALGALERWRQRFDANSACPDAGRRDNNLRTYS